MLEKLDALYAHVIRSTQVLPLTVHKRHMLVLPAPKFIVPLFGGEDGYSSEYRA